MASITMIYTVSYNITISHSLRVFITLQILNNCGITSQLQLAPCYLCMCMYTGFIFIIFPSACIVHMCRNHRVLKDSQRHVTRFIALGNVGNPDKKNRVSSSGSHAHEGCNNTLSTYYQVT